MSFSGIFTTIFGSAVFTFTVIMFWDKMVLTLGAFGGFLAAMLIPGSMWILNHGADEHLIVQSGNVWVDMAWAVGIGVLISSVIQGGSLKKSKLMILSAILGGIIGGYILNI